MRVIGLSRIDSALTSFRELTHTQHDACNTEAIAFIENVAKDDNREQKTSTSSTHAIVSPEPIENHKPFPS